MTSSNQGVGEAPRSVANRRRIPRTLLFAGLVLVVLVAFSPHWSASATLWTVDDSFAIDSGTQRITIQRAIDNATPGDTIVVNTGVYTEYVIVNKTVSISGNPRNNTFIAPGYSAYSFEIQANNVNISSLTFNLSDTAIYVGSLYSRLQVDSVTFEGMFMGVRVDAASNVSINNSYLGNMTYGVFAAGSYNTFLGNNTFVQNFYGAYFESTNASILRDGNHTNDNYGAYFQGSWRSVIDHNHMGNFSYSDAIGIAISSGCSQTVITSNRIDNFTGEWFGYGIQIDYSYDSSVKANDLSNVTHPITVTPYDMTTGEYYNHSILSTNKIDGRSVYYYVNATSVTVPSDAAWIGAFNVTGLTIPFQNISRFWNGIWLNTVVNASMQGYNSTAPTPQHKGYSLYIVYSTNVTIYRVNATGETSLGYIGYSLNVTVRDGSILGTPWWNGVMISAYSTTGLSLINNTVNLNGYTLFQIQSSPLLRVIGNTLNQSSMGYLYYSDEALYQDNVLNNSYNFIYSYGCTFGRVYNTTLTNAQYPVYLEGWMMEHYQWQIATNNTWDGRTFRSYINSTNVTIAGNLSWVLIANITNATSTYYDPNNGTLTAATIAFSTNITFRSVVANTSAYGMFVRDGQSINISNYSLNWSSYAVYAQNTRDLNITNGTWYGIGYEGIQSGNNQRLTVRNVTMTGNYAYALLEDWSSGGITIDNVTVTHTASIARFYYGTGHTVNRANQSVREPSDFWSTYYGVFAYNVSYLNVTNSTFRDGDYAVELEYYTFHVLIRNITVSNMLYHGISCVDGSSGNITIDGGTITGPASYSSSQDGVHLENVMAPVVVRNLNISQFWVGIFADPMNNITVQGNNISGVYDGIWLSLVSDSVIRSNTINGTLGRGIVVDRNSNNVTIDSNTVRNAASYSLLLSTDTRLNVTNNTVQGSSFGIYIEGGRDSSVSVNTVNGTSDSGIKVTSGHQNSTLTSNAITNSLQFGLYIDRVSYLTLISNTMSGSTYNFRIEAIAITQFHHTIPTTNTVNSKPIYFLVNQSGGSVPTTAGVAILANCSGTLVNGLTVDHNWHGVLIFSSSGITVLSVTAGTTRFGVEVRNSANTTVQDSTINDAEIGIQFTSSTNSTLTNNLVNSSSIYGVLLSSSNILNLTSNRISNSSFLGLYVSTCSGGIFTGNQMSNDYYSFYIFGSQLPHFNHSMPASNTINGAAIFYRLNTTNVVVPSNASAVVLANVTNATISDMYFNHTYVGIELFGSFNVSITNVTFELVNDGVHTRQTSNVTVRLLFSHRNVYLGGFLVNSDFQTKNITISDAAVTYGTGGIRMQGSQTANFSITNVTFGNRSIFRSSYYGLLVSGGVDNVTLSLANFSYTSYSTYIQPTGSLLRVTNLTVANSTFSRFTAYHVYSTASFADNVTYYHNNFQTAGGAPNEPYGIVRWYRDYPYGGNFWDNWTSPDVNGTATQTVAGADGIVDNPFDWVYTHDAYPLVDPWPPQIRLTSPINNSVIVAGTTLDFNVSRYYDSATYAINNGSITAFTSPFDISTSSFTDGTYHIWVNGTDATGENPSRWFVVAIDTTAPVISVVSPAAGSIYSPGTQLNFSIVDTHLALNATWSNGSANNSFSTIWNISTVGWADADYNITIRAWDTAGNSAQQTYAYGLDGLAPIINLVTPSNNSVIRAGTPIDLNIVEPHLLDASWNNGSGSNVLTGPFDINTTGWGDGPRTITIFANDTLGRQTMRQFNFVFDTTQPTVTLVTPPNNSYVQPGAILDFDVTDTNLASVVWSNGGVYASLAAPYNISTAAWADGIYTVRINATDAAGNFRNSSFGVTVDGTRPNITLGLPGNNSIGQPGVTMDFSITDTNFANATWSNGGAPAAFSSPFDLSTAGWADAAYTITIVANDLAGNSRTSTFGITIDYTAPTITLNGPPSGSVVRAGTIIDFSITDTNFNYATWNNGTSTVTFNGTFDINTAGWADGATTVTVYAYDLASNVAGPVVVTYTFDSNAPTITLSAPGNGSVVTVGTTLNLSITDANTFNASWNNGTGSVALTTPFDISTAGWAEGPYNVTVNATDGAGNTRFFLLRVTLDSTAPTVTRNSPANNSYIPAGTTLDFSVTDANLNSVVWSNGGAYTTLSSPAYDIATGSWSDAVYTVRINATDLAGNFVNVSFVFTIDSTAPTVTRNSPANNSYIIAGNTLDFSVTDTNLNTVVWSNGGAYTTLSSPAYDIATGSWSDAVYTVRINATDLAGNFVNVSFVFTIDSTPPTVTRNSPANNSYIPAGTTLDFSVTDTNLNAVVWSNGGAYTTLSSPAYDIATGSWSDAVYSVRINATDLAGNFVNVSFVFTIDSTPPVVVYNGPYSSVWWNGAVVLRVNTTLDFGVTDTNMNATAWTNGSGNNTLSNPFDFNATNWAEGLYTVRVNSTDLAGNTASATVLVLIDSTSPAWAFVTPGNGAYVTAGASLNFSLTETHPTGANWSNGSGPFAFTAQWNNTTGVVSGTTYTLSTTGWIDGVYFLNLSARDAAGNTVVSAFTVTVDSTAPSVVYNGPFGSLYWNGSIVLRANTTLDFGVVDANLNVSTWTNGSASNPLSTPFDLSTLGWADGLYAVRVNATDLAGNAAFATISIIIDSTSPSWSFVTPGNGAYVFNGTALQFNLTEAHPTAANWSNGGAPVAFTGLWNNATGVVSGNLYSISTAGWPDGVYFLNLSARDAAGNTVVSAYTVTVDSTFPVITLVSPPNATVVEAGTVIDLDIVELNLMNATWNNGSGIVLFTAPFDISTAGWADGTYNVTVRATDLAGSLTTRVFRFVFDNQFPVLPVPSWNGTFVDAGTGLDVTVVDANPLWILADIGTGPVNSSTTVVVVDTTGLPDGLRSVTVSAMDAAGHVTNATFVVTIDSTVPAFVAVAPANGSFIQPGVPVTFGVVEVNLVNVTWKRNGGVQLLANGSGPYSINTSGWGNTNNAVVLYARDRAGHITVRNLTLVTDSLPPVLPAFAANYSYAEDILVVFDASAANDNPNPLNNSSVVWNFSGRLNSLRTGFVVNNTWDTPGNYTVVLTVTDAAGNVNWVLFGVRALDTTAPVADAGANATVDEDSFVTLSGAASTDNDPDFAVNLQYAWSQVSGVAVAFNPNGITTTFTPIVPGVYTFELRVTDGAGLTSTARITLTARDITPPVLPAITFPIFNEGATVRFNASGTTDNDATNASLITYAWSFSDPSLVLVAGITGNHTFNTPGLFTINLTATDASGNVASRLIALRINDIPALADLPPTTHRLPGNYDVLLDIADVDAGDTHNVTVRSPLGMTVGTSGGSPTLHFDPGDFGIFVVNFTIDDGWSNVTYSYTLTVEAAVLPVNRPPVFTTEPPLEARSGSTYTYSPSATDPEGGRLLYGLDRAPATMTIAPSTGVISWLHLYNPSGGDHYDNVSLWVWDGANFAYQNYTIRFLAAGNSLPAIGDGVLGLVTVKEGATFEINVGPFVTDGNDAVDTLTFNVTVDDGTKATATLIGSGASTKIQVRGIAAGSATITLRVSDPSRAVATKPIQVTVEPVSTTPPPSDPFAGLLLPLLLAGVVGAGAMFFIVMRRKKDKDEKVRAVSTAPLATEVAPEVVAVSAPTIQSPPAAVSVSAAAAAASAAAVPAFAAAPGEKKITYTIEGLFVIYKDGRLLYSKTDMGAAKFEDPELVSSMFTAVQSFIKDSFQAEGELNKMGYGDNHVIIERGNHIFVAAIVYGDPDAEFTETLRGAIEGIELSYAGVIEGWDGMMDHFSDMDQKLAPVAALTAGITRREVQLATTKQEVLMLSELEFFQGFVRLKVGIKNNTPSVITKATVDIEYNEDVLRLGRVEPAAYRTSGAKVLLGVLNPGEKSSVAYYFDPQICTESQIDGVCRYRDASGVLHSVAMKTRKAEVVCPLFFTKEHANTAMLKRLVEAELNEKDAKVFEIQKMPPYIKYKDVFDLIKSVVNAHDVQQVREFVKYNPFQGEAWFYGETKVKGYKIVIRASVIEETNAIEFFAASTNMKAITGLLAEFNHTLNSMVIEKYSDLKIALTFDAEKKAEIDKKSLMSNMSSAELEGGETEQGGGGSPPPPGPGA